MDYMQWAFPIILGRILKTCPKPQEPSKEQDLIDHLRASFNKYIIKEIKYDYIETAKEDLNSKESKVLYTALKRIGQFDKGYDENGIYALSNGTSINPDSYAKFLNKHQEIRDEFYNQMKMAENSENIHNFIDSKIEAFDTHRFSDATLKCVEELNNLYRTPSGIKLLGAMALITASYLIAPPLILITGYSIPYAWYDFIVGPKELIIEQEQKASECKSYIMQDNDSPECSGLSMECNTYEQ